MSATVAAPAMVLAIALIAVRLRPCTARTPVVRPPRWGRVRGASVSRRRRGRGPTDVDVAAWCQRVARSSRSGSSLTQAIAEADAETPPDRRPFSDVGHALGRGRSLVDALATQPSDPSTAIGVAGPVLRACAAVGGPPAVPVERVADVLIARAAEQDERLAGSAQARLSARVLTAVPFGVVAFLAASEPAIRAVLATPAGLICLAAGAALNLLGRWWMSALIRKST